MPIPSLTEGFTPIHRQHQKWLHIYLTTSMGIYSTVLFCGILGKKSATPNDMPQAPSPPIDAIPSQNHWTTSVLKFPHTFSTKASSMERVIVLIGYFRGIEHILLAQQMSLSTIIIFRI
ncbi:hypothetical protein [Bartonella sp. ML70XJBT.G]|uniref:hypothetical protein n=1 Tax=Bartonella sp. ML70XJBT.G TaxID=3019093 RepID=UPI00235F27BA|nr:hypothetical protein [Bartonella sp. ML70XJBT.G]